MKAIDRFTRAYEQAGVKSFPVPELDSKEHSDEEPFVIYFTPMTLAEKEWIADRAGNKAQQTHAYTLIHKALDKDGNKLFIIEDKTELMSGGMSSIVERAALIMMEVLPLPAAIKK